MFTRERVATAAGEETSVVVSVCNVYHGLVFCKCLGAKLKLLNRKQQVVSVPHQGYMCMYMYTYVYIGNTCSHIVDTVFSFLHHCGYHKTPRRR